MVNVRHCKWHYESSILSLIIIVMILSLIIIAMRKMIFVFDMDFPNMGNLSCIL